MNFFFYFTKTKGWTKTFFLLSFLGFLYSIFSLIVGISFLSRFESFYAENSNISMITSFIPLTKPFIDLSKSLEPISFPLLLVFLIFLFIKAFIDTFYYYEITQSVVFSRPFSFIFSNNILDVIKKVLKLSITTLIYFFVIVGIPLLIFVCCFSVLFLLSSQAFNIETSLLLLTSITFIALCCLIPLYLFSFVVYIPAWYVLLKTNTFAESLKLGKVVSLLGKNLVRILLFMFVYCLFIFFVSLLIAFPSSLPSLITANNNHESAFFVYMTIFIPIQFILSFVNTYISFLGIYIFGEMYSDFKE